MERASASGGPTRPEGEKKDERAGVGTGRAVRKSGWLTRQTKEAAACQNALEKGGVDGDSKSTRSLQEQAVTVLGKIERVRKGERGVEERASYLRESPAQGFKREKSSAAGSLSKKHGGEGERRKKGVIEASCPNEVVQRDNVRLLVPAPSSRTLSGTALYKKRPGRMGSFDPGTLPCWHFPGGAGSTKRKFSFLLEDATGGSAKADQVWQLSWTNRHAGRRRRFAS